MINKLFQRVAFLFHLPAKYILNFEYQTWRANFLANISIANIKQKPQIFKAVQVIVLKNKQEGGIELLFTWKFKENSFSKQFQMHIWGKRCIMIFNKS